MWLNKSLLFTIVLLSIVSCRQGDSSLPSQAEYESILSHATEIVLTEHDSGWFEVSIMNPWDSTALLQRLALIPENLSTDSLMIPEDLTPVIIPLQRSLVTSTVHIGLLEELGSLENISAVTDVPYIASETIKKKIHQGDIVDCGTWMAPNIEKIILHHPDAILISPYQNGGNYSHLANIGIPIIYTADYLEKSPLGRAEWMKYYGLLYGKAGQADSLFSSIEEEYTSLKLKADSLAAQKPRKKVLLDVPTSGLWYVPEAGATNHQYIEDAGGQNPFAYRNGGEIITLPPEKVVYDAYDADIWIIRYGAAGDLTSKILMADYPYASRFKAFSDHNIWWCNTFKVPYFEETPFHPELLLKDFFEIINNPDVSDDSLRYFSRLEPVN